MIKFNNVSFSYNDKNVLRDFSLHIKKGDRICLFGDSGSGKTTITRLILGLEKPTLGNITALPNLRPSVVFQEDRLLPFKSVLENITVFGVTKETALQSLITLGLFKEIDSYPKELSGGMCRRVAIARAVSLDFDYLILDEPFTGLDEENILAAIRHINEILDDRPLILITHSKKEAELLNCEFKEII